MAVDGLGGASSANVSSKANGGCNHEGAFNE
jgi:hypothetical protein